MNKYKHLAPSNRSKQKAIWAKVRGAVTGCIRKRGFKDKQEACVAIARIRGTGGPDMRCYLCPTCKMWHLSRIKTPEAPTVEA